MDWITPVGSGTVALAGIVFGWATTVRSQRQTAELSHENNRHAHALAELAGDQALARQRLDHDRQARERREQSYVEVATTVIRLSTTLSADGTSTPDDLVRARVVAGLFASPPIRAAFDAWLDSFDKLRFALERRSTAADGTPVSTRDLHSPRDLWRRQADEARLTEVEAREHLITTMAVRAGRVTRFAYPTVISAGPRS